MSADFTVEIIDFIPATYEMSRCGFAGIARVKLPRLGLQIPAVYISVDIGRYWVHAELPPHAYDHKYSEGVSFSDPAETQSLLASVAYTIWRHVCDALDKPERWPEIMLLERAMRDNVTPIKKTLKT